MGRRIIILVCTLGQSWQVIPEAHALLAPKKCNLYRDQPRPSPIFVPALPEPSEVWVITKPDTRGKEDIDRLNKEKKGQAMTSRSSNPGSHRWRGPTQRPVRY